MMKKYVFALLFLAGFQMVTAQTDRSWKGYFSFNEIKDLSQSPSTIYAAAENALFSQNTASQVLKTTTTIDGLSGLTITALFHSEALNKTMVGYSNGLIIVINADGTMVNVVDIINKQLPSNIKKVNHFMEYNGIVYVSCDFGIVQYNLSTLLFGDTYFIGDNGAEIIVSQTAVYNGEIFAATSAGIRKAMITNPNLIDFSQWTQAMPGNWSGIETFGNELLATTSSLLFRYAGGSFGMLAALPLPVTDIRASENSLVVSTSDRVYLYNQSLTNTTQVNSDLIPDMNATFTCATVIGDIIYIGTLENGVIRTTVTNPSAFESISPSGPSRNNIFSINKTPLNLWVVFGSYTSSYDPYPYEKYGISKYNATNGWLNIPYEEVHMPGKEATDLVRVAVNPTNENTVYICSYHKGLLKFVDGVIAEQYDHTNSGLETTGEPGDPSIRIEQGAFDRQGNLWMTNGLIEDPLKVLKTDNSWQSVSFASVVGNPFDMRYGRMVIDKNNTKWICGSEGLYGYNESATTRLRKIGIGTETGNLPNGDVRAVAIDNRNQIWIGTRSGLAVLSSVDRFQSESSLNTNQIIIVENDTPTPLMYEQFVTDIAVDGANNKWIGTADAGIYLVSPDGQETKYHFTLNNSPLPSNTINDIDIDGTTGEVFIATSRGMVSFKGTATDASDNLNNVVVYPNPVRPGYNGTVKITGLLDKAHVKIADITGSLVYETITEGGTIEWDTTAFGKYKVASGVYMIFISAEDGGETKVKKVMIVR